MTARRWTATGRLGAALVAASAGVAGAALGGSAPAGATNVLAQAGYVLSRPIGKIKSLSAQWRVPAVEARSGPGRALTYTAAVDTGSGFELELGTVEAESRIRGRPAATYSGFWAETHAWPQTPPPIQARSLHAGDLVRATIGVVRGGWALHLQDLTAHWEWSRTLPLGGYQFNEASFLQEDPPAVAVPDAEQAPDVPYPRLPDVVFTRVRLNSQSADVAAGAAQALSVPDGPYLVPAGVHLGTFTVVAAKGPARQYLADIAPYNIGYGKFVVAYSAWRGSASTAIHDAAAVKALVSAADGFADAASAQHWPAKAEGAIHQYVTVLRQLAAVLRQLASLSTTRFSSWRSTVLKTLSETPTLSREIRAEVGLPPPAS